jgi:hypothetical protein
MAELATSAVGSHPFNVVVIDHFDDLSRQFTSLAIKLLLLRTGSLIAARDRYVF